MNPTFVFPPVYQQLLTGRVIPAMAPGSGYSSESILDRVPDVELDGVERDFLSGEVLQPVGDSLSASKAHLVGLPVAICERLSTCGSLKKGPTCGLERPDQGMEPRVLPVINTATQGHAQTLSGWMKDYPANAEHNAELQRAIQNGPQNLARGKHDVWISDHIDFGLKHAGWPSTEGIRDSDEKVPRYFRSLTIVNRSQQPVVLLDICGIPSVNHAFVLHDDHGLAHHYPRSHHKRDPKGVVLQTSAQYQITVELRCSPEDCAVHQQWLMFTFAVRNEKLLCPLTAPKKSVFIIGRRVSALVVKHVQDVQTCLSTEAKPFYPMYLRGVFNTVPVQFSCADESPCRKYMDFICKHNSSSQIGHLSVWKLSFSDLEKCFEANDRRIASALSSPVKRQRNKNRKLPLSYPPLSTRCSCYKRQLVQLVRLLALEEAAMELDVREHDLLNIQMECIDLQVNRFKIEVPGLPENRPCVFKGDVVYVRWAKVPHQECAALVLTVEMQPKPQIVIKLSAAFLAPHVAEWVYQVDTEERHRRLKLHRVHVRFMIDRLIIKNMHAAIQRTASSPAKLLPCVCAGITRGEGLELARPDPDVDFKDERNLAGEFVLINKSLNDDQQMAVKAVVNKVDGPGPYIIFGPPGTGKTVTVVECVLQVLKAGKSPVLCVCAPSNYAADILCSGISREGITSENMWRLNDPRRTVDSVKADVLQFCTMDNGVFTNVYLKPSTLKVIVSTCAAAAMLHEEPTKSRIGIVTHIFVDEAGQALIPETLIPLSLANQETCCVLCGDPKQLGPVVHSKLAATNGLAKSLLEYFTLSPQYRLEGTNGLGSARVIKLLRNYRANRKLLELPSRMFYGNELIASAEEHQVAPPENWEEMRGFTFPMLFYGVRGQQMREGESPSYFNAVETTKVVDLIAGLLDRTDVKMEEIGVMAPFRRQVQKLRLVLRARNLGAIRVGTVDDYQGQEERIIFISTVLTRPESLRRAQIAGAPEQNVGFLSNAKRFNVAITRAKAMLVVVGHPVILSADDNWQVLLRYCLSRGAFRGYGSDKIPSFLSSSSAVEGPFADSNELEEASNADEADAREREEIDNAIERIAEMSLLGLGDVERLYPDTLDSYYAANSEDREWRVVM